MFKAKKKYKKGIEVEKINQKTYMRKLKLNIIKSTSI